MAYTKVVRVKGKEYVYFDRGIDETPRWKRLPDRSVASFGAVYAAHLGHRSRKEVGAMTVPKLIQLYQASPKFAKLAENTQKLYRRYHSVLANELPTAKAQKVERKDIVLLMDDMADRPGAANMFLATASALWVWGRQRGHVTNRPADDIERLEGGGHEPWPLELLSAALTDPDDTLRLAVHLLYYTAQRISDVVQMRWSHFSATAVSVEQKKTGKELLIDIHPNLAAELNGRKRDLRTLLISKKGKPFTDQTLRYLLKSWATAKGFDVVPHGLRKNAVNTLLEVGCSVAETAAVSGQSLAMVEYYARRRNQSKLSSAAMKKWGGTDADSSNDTQIIRETP